mmetsp:Transcript_348/g.650  ORF Transcript_348/g.650 Transcript_348/m.650 type:complete len:236 (-) Transcript_348:468-1175(-)
MWVRVCPMLAVHWDLNMAAATCETILKRLTSRLPAYSHLSFSFRRLVFSGPLRGRLRDPCLPFPVLCSLFRAVFVSILLRHGDLLVASLREKDAPATISLDRRLCIHGESMCFDDEVFGVEKFFAITYHLIDVALPVLLAAKSPAIQLLEVDRFTIMALVQGCELHECENLFVVAGARGTANVLREAAVKWGLTALEACVCTCLSGSRLLPTITIATRCAIAGTLTTAFTLLLLV